MITLCINASAEDGADPSHHWLRASREGCDDGTHAARERGN